jgi:uncharacterized membrane protein YoaK (UPF0700 family)
MNHLEVWKSDFAFQGPIFLGLWLLIVVVVIAGLWKVFVKAGQPGWACIIPIYNLYCWIVEIGGKEWWWFFLYLIPIVNIVIAILVAISVSRNFGKGVAFALGLIFLPFIFLPILGFGDATYGGRTTPPVAA